MWVAGAAVYCALYLPPNRVEKNTLLPQLLVMAAGTEGGEVEWWWGVFTWRGR
jgi:hypothetical protein